MARFDKPDTRVHDALKRIGPLPVLGGTVARIRTLANDPHGTTSDLVQVIESDEAFSANLLRYANSAAYMRAIRARTIRQAVTLLGRRALVRIALEAETYRFLERFPGGAHLSRGQLHVHAVTVAAYSATTADLRGAHTDTAHLAGLLHDVGKLLMPAAFGVQPLEDIAAEAPFGVPRAELERRILGLDHAQAGSLLVGLSEPDDDVTRAIAYHHGGPTGLAVPSDETACVIVGDVLAHMVTGGEPDRELLAIALDRLGATADLLDEVAEKAGVAATGASGDLAEAVGRLEAVAHTDDLTGLHNRRSWIETVRRDLATGTEGALLICDVDGFKHVNDTHGHRAGDLVLTEVARVLARHGVAGRLGGDEFGVWVRAGEVAGRQAADAIMQDVANTLPVELVTGENPLGITVGLASAPQGGAEVMELIEAADRELYAAKPGGRRSTR
ncbi:HDOD domain-containing protein [Solirubrobacter sp. CPCC 204708]|uniref:GGDEF domain-containing protein n=1 Tax=Solirubrobacter deserti TaxID=2282478 RepID=A0ABT4REH0_9ACTN|nr:GGDEF domain-containing protein [Solirubrobacter deserti]MBE2318470.1 HDOD domain-containing protein [Solirubrobacter deserti]MDA0136928.1 GGDEF domain-containing protein [Solirubrobacter deserti]